VQFMTEVEEMSKALAESAKFGTTSVEATQKMLGFLSKVFNEPIETTVGIIGDKLKFIRWQRQLRMADEVYGILRQRGVDKTRPIPPKFAISMLEQSSLEEDNELQDIWCNLIANSLDPSFNSEIRYAFIEIIKGLTPLDSKILYFVYNRVLNKSLFCEDETQRHETMQSRTVQISRIQENIDASEEYIRISVSNLIRVQCLNSFSTEYSVKTFGSTIVGVNSVMNVAITPLGIVFVEACIKRN